MGYKVDIQKLIALLYAINEQVVFEIKNTIPLNISTPKKQRKYLGINLTKHVQGLYEENCKTLMKKEPSEWRDIPCL